MTASAIIIVNNIATTAPTHDSGSMRLFPSPSSPQRRARTYAQSDEEIRQWVVNSAGAGSRHHQDDAPPSASSSSSSWDDHDSNASSSTTSTPVVAPPNRNRADALSDEEVWQWIADANSRRRNNQDDATAALGATATRGRTYALSDDEVLHWVHQCDSSSRSQARRGRAYALSDEREVRDWVRSSNSNIDDDDDDDDLPTPVTPKHDRTASCAQLDEEEVPSRVRSSPSSVLFPTTVDEPYCCRHDSETDVVPETQQQRRLDSSTEHERYFLGISLLPAAPADDLYLWL